MTPLFIHVAKFCVSAIGNSLLLSEAAFNNSAATTTHHGEDLSTEDLEIVEDMQAFQQDVDQDLDGKNVEPDARPAFTTSFRDMEEIDSLVVGQDPLLERALKLKRGLEDLITPYRELPCHQFNLVT